jgi:prepilin-type N-terminal cleavage/methylation domain-containing protein
MQKRRGFTLIETVVALAMIVGLLVVLLPMGKSVRNADGMRDSILNVQQILIARAMYSEDHADQIPMRGSRYQNGQLSGWDTWHFGGKNPSSIWRELYGGVFDESAYSRPLNAYLRTDGSRIPKPVGYLNTGSGSTWNFLPGNATNPQRASLKIPVFKSPGDVATRQRNWPNPTPGVSCYDDVGTSYLLNMKWWDQPGLPSQFTARFNEGVNRIRLIANNPSPNTFVWVHDQIADLLVNSGPGAVIQGEFGGNNRSVLGFIDGRADYMQVTPGVSSGTGYTFFIP